LAKFDETLQELLQENSLPNKLAFLAEQRGQWVKGDIKNARLIVLLHLSKLQGIYSLFSNEIFLEVLNKYV